MSKESRAQQLLDVAEALFAERGYEAVTLEDVAQAAGVTRALIYLHYAGGKDELLLTCVRRGRAAFEEAVRDAAGADDDPQDQIARGVDAYFRVLERDPARWQLLFGPTGPVVGALADALTDERLRTTSLIADVFAAHAPHVPRLRLDLYAQAVSGAAEQVGRWWLRHPEVTRPEVVAGQVDLVWAGLRELLEAGA